MARELNVILLFSVLITTATSSVVYVDVAQGTLMGETIEFTENEFLNISTKIDVFKGVPYAEPPSRFRPPVPRKRWGEWDATQFRAVCPQSRGDGVYLDEFTVSEDCLYLNIFAPHDTEDPLPVIVFIHGGGFIGGTSMVRDYSGVPMAAIGNVVIVTISYRVGVLGFLDAGEKSASGNYGLLDQAEAMRWVRNNIGAFRGDSSRITLYGESAGSASVHLHMLSEYSRDLFDQAIMSSGVATAAWSFDEEKSETAKREMTFKIGRAAGCESEEIGELIGCLRQALWSTVHNASLEVGYQAKPTIDGVFLEDSPRRLLERGDFKQCPITVGFNRDEGSLFMLYRFQQYFFLERPFINKTLFKQLVREVLQVKDKHAPDLIVDSVNQQYMDWSEAENEEYDYYDVITAIAGEKAFGCPSLEVAKSHATMTSEPVFLYHMTHVPTSSIYTAGPVTVKWLGAGHAEDLRFVFGYAFIPGLKNLRGPMTDDEIELTVKFIQFWSNFARSGDPSQEDPSSPPGEGEWEWPAYTVPDLKYKELSLGMAVKRGLKANECAFWNDYKPKLEQYLASQDEVENDWRDEFSDWKDDLQEWRRAFKKYENENSCI